MNINFNQFINIFDIIFIITVTISFFFGVKNGLIKSLLNVIKWIIIFYLIKSCFKLLRPIFDTYIFNQTLSDILIFTFTLIVSYILISFINRIIFGILQPKRSFFLDMSFGGVLGIFRGLSFLYNWFAKFSIPFLSDKSRGTIVHSHLFFVIMSHTISSFPISRAHI